jgi:hypothetical protein
LGFGSRFEREEIYFFVLFHFVREEFTQNSLDVFR